ncbi:glycoside hydrolase family 18 [Bacteroides faecalis]|uniref:Endoglycosidase n=1 Tax=Bacteroides faecalis TaxID=2447885 RepID=A0A401LS28_9BACE|nr:glycoside hydrolase family 18 [Bacteroides faecalis]GCB34355.1 endoglycosidase [Bacteroides faecalis]
MKNILYYFLSLIGLCALFSACEDWTETEVKNPENLIESSHSEEYYTRLRAYKASDHPIAFGWFGNWTGTGVSLMNSMAGLPDSVDVISMWGGWKNPSAAMLEDLRFVQQQKGIKALVCFILLDIGAQITPVGEEPHKFWGWVDGDDEAIERSIRKYANALCDTIDKYNYDGYDLDWEPSYSHPFQTSYEMAKNGRIGIFIDEMSKRIGPRSGTGRLFVIDGEPGNSQIPKEMGKCFDYFIVQAYSATSDAALMIREHGLNDIIKYYDGVLSAEECAKKYIVTEDFEKYASTGGLTYTDSEGNKMNSVEGMARWNPIINGKKVRKGGVGTFHMEYEYMIDGKEGTYPYLRKAIQLMNPAVK